MIRIKNIRSTDIHLRIVYFTSEGHATTDEAAITDSVRKFYSNDSIVVVKDEDLTRLLEKLGVHPPACTAATKSDKKLAVMEGCVAGSMNTKSENEQFTQEQETINDLTRIQIEKQKAVQKLAQEERELIDRINHLKDRIHYRYGDSFEQIQSQNSLFED